MSWEADDDEYRSLVGPPHARTKPAIAERVRHAMQMKASGYSMPQIVDFVGVTRGTIQKYWYDPRYREYRIAAQKDENPYL